MILFTTIILDIYIALLSLQVNGIVFTDAIRIPMLIFMVVESVFLVLTRILPKKMNASIHIPGVLLCAITFILYLGAYLLFVDMTVSRIVELAFFPLCLFITYINFIEIKKEKTFDHIVDVQFYYLIVVAMAFFVAQIQRRDEFFNNVNTVYYVIFSLPFILQHKNKYKKYIGLVIILTCLFFSLKRTPLLAVGLCLIFYNKTKNTTNKIIKRCLGVLCGFVVVDFIFSNLMGIRMLERLMSLADDGGSGRIDLANQAIELLAQSSFGEFIFGHSLIPTAMVFELGAHNDFLEVFYRMGFVGFLLFLGYFAGILTKIRSFNNVNDYANSNALQTTFILFIVVAFSSQLIFLPTYVGLIAMSISFSLARHRFIGIQMQ